jgi:hypothetical protein
VAIPFTDDLMAYDSGNRLLLCTLVKGLRDAVRRDDLSASKRYRRRLRLATEQIAADDPVHDVFQRLLYTSGHWAATAAASAVKPSSKRSKSSNASSSYLHHDDISSCRPRYRGWRTNAFPVTWVTPSPRRSTSNPSVEQIAEAITMKKIIELAIQFIGASRGRLG